MRRGDNIPSISDYSHWNEDAAAMWYAENRYDMEHWDEEIEDDDEPRDYEEPEPDIYETFDTEEAARAFYEKIGPEAHSVSGPQRYGDGEWYVEGFSTALYEQWTERRRKRRMVRYE